MPIERYVSALAAGGGTGTVSNPWTLTEGFANALPGDRVNIKADGVYTRGGADTIAAAATGTFDNLVYFRGYKTTINDGNLGFDSSGKQILTNMPEITYVGNLARLILRSFNVLESLNILGAYAGTLVSGTTYNSVQNCKIRNVSDNVSSSCLQVNSNSTVMNCTLELAGADSLCCLNLVALGGRVIGCRFKGEGKGNGIQIPSNTQGPVIEGCTFNTVLNAVAVTGTNSATANSLLVRNCTAYNLVGAFIQLPNVLASTSTLSPIAINNHVTDSAYFMQNLYAPTSAVPRFADNNRLRDIANPDAGWVELGPNRTITTDTGGAETDYVDAANGNFYLIAGAAGRGTGYRPNTDIGAWQSAGGGTTITGIPSIGVPRRSDY